ncbi:hypothetical protein PR202_gb05699 [Eleusine coracana subsp. coracana]|uniref:Uncharacterized protein n=1 Tax=Eleusine coracana subsp. coracana TaxID=191504 RepID=A0AAV5E713_ELECO|nr:hypothetical protein PR202_gb05699 [Eleusine coracana subsp. coracana]
MSQVVEVLKPLQNLKDMASSSYFFQSMQHERGASLTNPHGSQSMKPSLSADEEKAVLGQCVTGECGTGEYAEKELQYGEWMMADEASWQPGTPRVRTTFQKEAPQDFRNESSNRSGRAPGRSGRGRAGARGASGQVWKAKEVVQENPGSRKRNYEEAGVGSVNPEDLKDTASSLLKAIAESEDDKEKDRSVAHRQLILCSA